MKRILCIGLVGCGNLGTILAREIPKRFPGQARLIGVYDVNPAQAQKLQSRLRRLRSRLSGTVPILNLTDLFRRSHLILEAASPSAVADLLPRALAHRRSLLLLSTGGLLEHRALVRKILAQRIPIYLPSGAVFGVDGVKAAAMGGIRSITLTTRKPPQAFRNLPEATRRRIGLSHIRRPRVLFSGSARRAARAFPTNINVAATLAWAGLGPDRTRVRIVADPTVRSNVHEVEVIGRSCRLFARAENRPVPGNPGSSRLAAESVLATLDRILKPLQVGT